MHPYYPGLQSLTHCFRWSRRNNETIRQLLISSSAASPMKKESRSKHTDIPYATYCSPFRFAHRNHDEFPFNRHRALLRKRYGGYRSTVERYAPWLNWKRYTYWPRYYSTTIHHSEKNTENRANRTIIMFSCEVDYAFLKQNLERKIWRDDIISIQLPIPLLIFRRKRTS